MDDRRQLCLRLAQRAEYLLDKGMVDLVVDRRQLKQTLSTLLSVLMHKRAKPVEDAETIELSQLAAEDEAAESSKGKRKEPKSTRAKAAE
jgi:acetyl-CoA carboxylase carboxyl transferase subunit beta